MLEALGLLLSLAVTQAAGAQPAEIDSYESEAALCAAFRDYAVREKIPEEYLPEPDSRDVAEVFANGEGVKRDLDAAIHFICGAEDLAPAERWGMLEHVQSMRAGKTSEPLDFCDHATSGRGSLVCALRRQDELVPELEARFEKIRQGSGGKLAELRKAADAFIEAESAWLTEQTRGGTIYPSMAVNTFLDGEESFVVALERFSASRASAATTAEAKGADADLNATYRRRLSDIEPCDPEISACPPGEPTETDLLRAAQRAWIPYRDAFIAWYQERWSGAAPRDVLRREILTRLTRDRTVELQSR